jgi:hypothetical protein
MPDGIRNSNKLLVNISLPGEINGQKKGCIFLNAAFF